VTRDDHEATAVLRISAAVPLAAGAWPHTAFQAPDGEISVGGLQLSELAETYGTPAYILDEADVRHRCRAYHAAFPGAEVVYAGKAFLCRAMAQWCARRRMPVPRLVIEHGPAIVGRAAVTLYRVLGVKRAPGGRAFVAVDGGMSDNARPAACGRGYPVRALRLSTAPDHTVTVVGRHCEAGEVIAADVPLPEDVRPGDVLAVPGTGAYNQSMASNCNMVGRPPVIAVRDGAARVLVRRETASDLLSRDVGL
jgi:diaminopimelate decarboxylase